MSDAERKQSLRTELVTLGYPWPDHLEGKSKAWLEAEIRVLRPTDAKAANERAPQRT
jgi:hypothetical protein